MQVVEGESKLDRLARERLRRREEATAPATAAPAPAPAPAPARGGKGAPASAGPASAAARGKQAAGGAVAGAAGALAKARTISAPAKANAGVSAAPGKAFGGASAAPENAFAGASAAPPKAFAGAVAAGKALGSAKALAGAAGAGKASGSASAAPKSPPPAPPSSAGSAPLSSTAQRFRELGIGSNKLSSDEVQCLRQTAVVREREKRRAAREAEESAERSALAAAKQEAIRREKERSVERALAASRPAAPGSLKAAGKAAGKAAVAASLMSSSRGAPGKGTGPGKPRVSSSAELRAAQAEAVRRARAGGEDGAQHKENSARQRQRQRPVSADEARELKAAALAREQALERRRAKTAALQAAEAARHPDQPSLTALRAEMELRGGLLPLVQAERLAQQGGYVITRRDGLGKMVSWLSLEERLAPAVVKTEARVSPALSAGPAPAPAPSSTTAAAPTTTSTVSAQQRSGNLAAARSPAAAISVKELERRVLSLIALCEVSFRELERHSLTRGRVRPSDIDAVLGDSTDEDSVRIVRGGLRVPALVPSRQDDEPVTWPEYREWIVQELLEGRAPEAAKRLLLSFEPPAAAAAPVAAAAPLVNAQAAAGGRQPPSSSSQPPRQQQPPPPPQHQHQQHQQQPQQPKPPPPELAVVNSKITALERSLRELQQREEGPVAASPKRRPQWSDSEEDEAGKAGLPAPAPGSPQPAEDERVLFSGRCWMMCERRREQWMEWARAREVCASVKVTQLNAPFRMYIGAQLLRSELRSTRRIGVEELTALTAACAARHAAEGGGGGTKLALSRSGRHVDIERGGDGGERYRVRSLGPEEWTREQLQAAIGAEQAMAAWVAQGRIPKQNDLVQWLLLHCVLRIEGDEADPEMGNLQIVLPGDDEAQRGGGPAEAPAPATALGGPASRHNRVIPEEDAAQRKALELVVAALDYKNLRAKDVIKWFSYQRGPLVDLLQSYAGPELARNDVKSLLRRCESAAEVLSLLLPRDRLKREWRQKTKRTRVADVFDLFRRQEEVPGRLSAPEFCALLQDQLRIDIPEWQLVVWHGEHPAYRSFLKEMYVA
jgi:hypothetical protein